MTAPVTVIGYVTLEHSLVVADRLQPDRTAIVTDRPSGHAGRAGGCAAYIAQGLTAQSLKVVLAARVGADPAGDELVRILQEQGVDIRAIEQRGTTPNVWMVYSPDGDGWCIYDPADGVEDPLTGPQRAALAAADWCVVAVGPRAATAAALDALTDDQKLLWSVKADSRSWPPDLVARLAGRADVVMLSERERDWVATNLGADLDTVLRPGALLVETRGRHGLRWSVDGRSGTAAPMEVVDVLDASGAGDWAVAGLLAALLDNAGPAAAASAANFSAARLLRTRSPEPSPTERQSHT